MKKQKRIHNIESLEREIFRLRLESRDQEKKIADNVDKLGEKGFSLFMNSLFCKNPRSTGSNNKENHSFFRNEKLNSIVSNLTDRIADRVAGGIGALADRIF